MQCPGGLSSLSSFPALGHFFYPTHKKIGFNTVNVCTCCYQHSPQHFLGSHWKTGLFVCFHVSHYYTAMLGKKNENLWESLRVMWMEPSGGPLSTQCTPSEDYWMPPFGFAKSKPLATSSARPRAKNHWACSPSGFWPLVWPLMWPRVRL